MLLLPDVLLVGYRNGFFPMSEPDSGRILWHRPDPRAIIPLDDVRLSRSTQQVMRSGLFTVTVDACFEDVMRRCSHRDSSWISEDLISAYTGLHDMGHAHSIETWIGDELVGGLYGVNIGGAFFGESMFSVVSNASKVAFGNLVAILRANDFRLLDTQYINDFTASLGAIEIADAQYQVLLVEALVHHAEFLPAL